MAEDAAAGHSGGVELTRPARWRAGVILASPHSGRDYPPTVQSFARVPLAALTGLEDRHVDAVALAARGVGSCWIGSTIFAADVVRRQLELDASWEPMGAIAIGYPHGYPEETLEPRTPLPAGQMLVEL